MGDKAATFGNASFYALSMVVDKTGKLIGICASAAPATHIESEKRLKTIAAKYGAPSITLPQKQYVFTKAENYVQLSLIAAMDDYNKPIPDTYITRLYILDKAYTDRIKEGINGNEFAALLGH
jgi:hypothetical protein